MPAIVILSGAPGTGKTTVAALLASGAPRGLHLPADLGPYGSHALQTAGLAPEEVAGELLRRRISGIYRLDTQRASAAGAGGE